MNLDGAGSGMNFGEGASTIPALQPSPPAVLQRHHLDTFAEALFSRRAQCNDSTRIFIAHPAMVTAIEEWTKGNKRPHSRGRRKKGRDRGQN